MDTHHPNNPLPRKILISIVLLICGLIVFVLGTNWYSVFPTNDSQAYRIVVAVAFLATALFLRRGESSRQYGDIAYAFFIAMVAFFLVSQALGIRASLLEALQVPADTDQFLAFSKVFESLFVVAAILFQFVIFPMALLFGYLIYKTESIWASVLFHAGSDVFLFYLMVL